MRQFNVLDSIAAATAGQNSDLLPPTFKTCFVGIILREDLGSAFSLIITWNRFGESVPQNNCSTL